MNDNLHPHEYGPLFVDVNNCNPVFAILERQLKEDFSLRYGLDIETYRKPEWKNDLECGLGADFCSHRATIRLVQIASEPQGTSYIVDMMHVSDYVKERLIEFLQVGRFYSHNAMFETQFIQALGVRMLDVHCTMVMYRMLVRGSHPFPSKFKSDLKSVVKTLLKIDVSKEEQTSDWSIPELTEDQITYAARDAAYTYIIGKLMLPKLEASMSKSYRINRNSINALSRMVRSGIYFDKKDHKKLVRDWQKKRSAAEESCEEVFEGINIRSGTQLGDWIKENISEELLKDWPKTEKGSLKTDAKTLAEYDGVPGLTELCEYKMYQKLLSTYGTGLTDYINPVTGRLHPGYTLAFTTTGRLSSRAPNCFSGDTELLTTQGWKPISNICADRELPVAQWKDGVITFEYPEAYHEYPSSGKLLHLHSQQIDLKVTPDHRCLLFKRSGIQEVVEAKNMPFDRIQIHAGMLGDNDWSDHTLSSYPDLVRMIVATQADGYFNNGGIEFNFRKERKYLRLLDILNRLTKSAKDVFTVDYTDYSKESYFKAENYTGMRYRVRVIKSSLVDEIRLWLPNKLFSTKLPSSLTREGCSIFMEEIMYWDGLSTRQNNYSSSNKSNVDVVQAIAALNNRRARYRTYENNTPTAGTSYQLDIPFRNYSWTTNLIKEEIEYKGTVYCVSVPSSFLVVRSSGKVMVTGNCQNQPVRENSIRKYFRAQHKNSVLVCADYSQIEVRVAAILSEDPKLIKVYKDGADVYRRTASQIYGIPEEKVTKAERQTMKAVVLGLQFGMGAAKLAVYAKQYGVDMTEDEALTYVNTYRKKVFPTLYKWQTKTAQIAQKTLSTSTVGGMIRKLTPENYYTCSMNTPVQGSAAEVMLMAITILDSLIIQNKLPARIVCTVHDEIVVECLESAAERVAKFMEKSMVQAFRYVFPDAKGCDRMDFPNPDNNLVSANIGKTWEDAK